MSLKCVDCGAGVCRLSVRGPNPKRCQACKKLKAAIASNEWKRTKRSCRPKKVHVVKCVTCEKHFVAQRPHAKHCSKTCRNRSRSNCGLGKHSNKCLHCCQPFKCNRRQQSYCSPACAQLARRKRITVECERHGCKKHFETTPARRLKGHRFCCRECSYLEPLICQNPKCGRAFRMKHKTKDTWKNAGKYCCPECYRDHRWGQHRRRKKSPQAVCRAAAACALATSLRKRCKAFGVTFDPACTRMAVLERDGWRCQKCRVLCNKEYRLSNRTKSPHWRNAEHDHIVPLSVAGSPGNVFQNSQCLCRRCNAAKSDKRDGQLRLPIEEEAWGKGVRVRSPRSSRFSEAIPATVL